MRSSGLIVAIMLLAGCAAHDSKTADRLTCGQPGSETDMRCHKRKRVRQDLVQICETRVISRNCYYVTRQELERMIREMQGQR